MLLIQVPVHVVISDYFIVFFSFEKMISDEYQGVIVCLVLKDLISKRELFEGRSSPKFDKFEAFSRGRLSTMEGWYVVSISVYSIFKVPYFPAIKYMRL
jgi:hypothetical protein